MKIPQLPPNQNSHELQSLAQVGVDEGTFEGDDTVMGNEISDVKGNSLLFELNIIKFGEKMINASDHYHFAIGAPLHKRKRNHDYKASGIKNKSCNFIFNERQFLLCNVSGRIVKKPKEDFHLVLAKETMVDSVHHRNIQRNTKCCDDLGTSGSP
ncbi:hypothetical protein Leryth_027596 [Lithospermum erythrorhizon]|nr:hypothetical protein Leryth_027596 [Lithospermum erythrorhizon]